MTDNMQSNIKIQNKKVVFGYADYCVVISLFCIFLILLAEPIKSDVVVRVGSRVLIIDVLCFAFLQLLKVTKAHKLKDAFCAFMLYFVVGICSIICGITVVIGKAVNLFCFLMLPTIILLFKNVKNAKAIKNMIFIANIVYTLLWTVLYFTPLSHVYYNEFGSKIIDELTLGYANSNQLGMYLLVSFIISLVAFNRDNKIKVRLIFLLQSIWMVILIFQTGSRICLSLVVVVVIIWAFKCHFKMGTKAVAVVLIAPLIFALLFMFQNQSFLNAIFLGETVDNGRKWVVNNFVKTLTPLTFLLGDFASFVGANLHNSYVTIFAVTGIFGFLAYVVFLWKELKFYLSQTNRKSSSDMLAVAGILVIIVHGVVETAFITSGMIYAGLFGLLFVLTLNEGES